MNQRREARAVASHSVWITILGTVDNRIPARIRNASGRGMGLEVAQEIGTGSALQIEVEDSLLFGEAIYCRAEKGAYYVGVELEEALHGLAELGEVLREF
jgi:ribulose-5-phosphate 4-epimerase/fuculose-1-phosphate aldolase